MGQRDIDVEGRTFRLIQYGPVVKIYMRHQWPKNEDGFHTRTHFYAHIADFANGDILTNSKDLYTLCVVAIATHRLEGGRP